MRTIFIWKIGECSIDDYLHWMKWHLDFTRQEAWCCLRMRKRCTPCFLLRSQLLSIEDEDQCAWFGSPPCPTGTQRSCPRSVCRRSRSPMETKSQEAFLDCWRSSRRMFPSRTSIDHCCRPKHESHSMRPRTTKHWKEAPLSIEWRSPFSNTSARCCHATMWDRTQCHRHGKDHVD